MVSVGVLAAAINVSVLFVLTVSDRVVMHILRRLAHARLLRKLCAPVIHSDDTWLPYLPRSLVKFRRYPAIVLTILSAAFLLSAELVTEVGVQSSSTCAPAARSGAVIFPGDVRESNAGDTITIAHIASAAHLQGVEFRDGDLTSVPSGFPQDVHEAVCIPCLEGTPILAGCEVREGRVYEAGELSVGFLRSNSKLSSVCTGFKEISGTRREFPGKGDLTHVGEKFATFALHASKQDGKSMLTYFEYGNQGHSKRMMERASEAYDTTRGLGVELWERTESPTFTQTITCEQNVLSIDMFQKALLVYRSMHLENTVKRAGFDESTSRFAPLRADDVYRGVLALKLADVEDPNSVYWEYTECATYNVVYMVPVVVAICILCLLVMFAHGFGRCGADPELPYTTAGVLESVNATGGFDYESGLKKDLKSEVGKAGWWDLTRLREVVAIEEVRLECDHAHELMRIRAKSRDRRSGRRSELSARSLPIRRVRFPRLRLGRRSSRRRSV